MREATQGGPASKTPIGPVCIVYRFLKSKSFRLHPDSRQHRTGRASENDQDSKPVTVRVISQDSQICGRSCYSSGSLTEGDGGGQTGSFPFFEVSSHYEPGESCETNIRKRPVCPRVRRPRVPGTLMSREAHAVVKR